ncbi:MAG TPA: protein kinase [Pyrinomonadaceae bacterium]|nr:protein kinase [Pyrinomonadaceae bacterium]
MTLTTGTKLGRYEISGQLGVGGMGEVYLAEDTALNRKVAVKILPADLALKKERMARFVREAKAAAALNHPNIAHIYEIGEQDGMHFIAMEYVEGKTLREKIHYERSDLRKLLKYLQQVAGGLAKAHAVGIVHRDLKPDNIMISRDGYAKILDFGLAKLVEPTGVGASETASDVATVEWEQPHSLPGKLLGTVGYMSPEQAQGKTDDIDHRSDIFSFGCMLYEAITGRRPFQGESNVQSLYRIVYEPAPPIKDLNPLAPPELQRIVRRCLAKDPDERYQSAQDIALELKELRREIEGDTQIDTTVAPSMMGGEASRASSLRSNFTPTMPSSAVTNLDQLGRPTTSTDVIISEIKQHKRGLLLALVGLVVVAGALIWLWARFGNTPQSAPFRTMKITRLTTGGKIGNASIKGYTSISPDGRYVVFRTTESAKDSLWVRQVSTGSLVKILPDSKEKIGGTTFSRDGEFVYYSTFDDNDAVGTLYRVPVLGGSPQRIMGGVTSSVTFSPDGKQMSFIRHSSVQTDLMVANLNGSEERAIASRKLPSYFSWGAGPAWAPDGKTIACGAGVFSGSLSSTVVSVPASGGTEQPITSQNWVSVSRVQWQQDGSGLVIAAVPELTSAGTQLWYVSYPGGQVRRITNDLNAYGTTSLGLTADSKTLVTIQADRSSQIWVVTPGADVSRAKQITQGKYDGDTIAWTPEGRVIYTAPSGEQIDIWSVNADGSDNKQLTADTYTESLGCVSADGRQIVFSSNRSGNFNIWKLALGARDQQQLTQGHEMDGQALCSPDGQWILFKSFRQGKPTVWKVPLAGGEPQQLLDKSSAWAAISPDGKLVAVRYLDEQSNKNKIAVLPFGGGEVIQSLDVSVNFRDVGLGWTDDSRSIIYADGRDSADNIWSVPLAGGPPKQLTNFSSGLVFAFQVSRDGKQIAISRGTQTDDVILMRDSE